LKPAFTFDLAEEGACVLEGELAEFELDGMVVLLSGRGAEGPAL
jgi:hypothetical protein